MNELLEKVFNIILVMLLVLIYPTCDAVQVSSYMTPLSQTGI